MVSNDHTKLEQTNFGTGFAILLYAKNSGEYEHKEGTNDDPDGSIVLVPVLTGGRDELIQRDEHHDASGEG